MVKHLLGSKYNLIQAPMAGVTTPSLVIEVLKAGGFGMLAAGDNKPEQLEDWISEVRQATDLDFGVNFFVPRAFTVPGDELSEVRKNLKPLYEAAGIEQDIKRIVSYSEVEENFYAQIETCLKQGIRVYSFIFGVPPESVTKKIKDAGGLIIATATTIEEAVLLEESGADIIVAQGDSAGGHRGTFIDDVENSLMDTYEFVHMISKRLTCPVVAAGGIMTSGHIKEIMEVADGVQLGTAFITVKESGASAVHKTAILEGKRDTKLSRAFTGRHARALTNKVMNDIETVNAIVQYPVQRGLTAGLQEYGKKEKDKEYAMMLAGSHYHYAKETTAEDLILSFVKEADDNGL